MTPRRASPHRPLVHEAEADFLPGALTARVTQSLWGGNAKRSKARYSESDCEHEDAKARRSGKENCQSTRRNMGVPNSPLRMSRHPPPAPFPVASCLPGALWAYSCSTVVWTFAFSQQEH